jgi:hypothetical protein
MSVNYCQSFSPTKDPGFDLPPANPIRPSFDMTAPLYVEGPMGRWIVSSRRLMTRLIRVVLNGEVHPTSHSRPLSREGVERVEDLRY